MNREILRLAIPSIVSNITVPLLGLVDLFIVGHLQSELYIGAIAIATMIFNLIYWNFTFLRMGTSGFTSQAFGADNKPEMTNALLRSLGIAALFSFIILVLQNVILGLAFRLLGVNAYISVYIVQYFDIYVWAAPAILGMYAFNGWLVGMQDTKTPMFIAIVVNVVNITLSLIFVFVLGMQIEGVALGSLLAQWLGFTLITVLSLNKHRFLSKYAGMDVFKDYRSFIPFFKVNSDIFLRTLCIIAVTTFFTSQSEKMGNTILAVNTLMLQLFMMFSYMMDGLAYAAEALTGKYIGARNTSMLNVLVKRLFMWGGAFALLFAAIYGIFIDPIFSLITDKQNVIDASQPYQFWAIFIPIAGFAAFLWDGIFVGATASKYMRNAMMISVFCFFCMFYTLSPVWGNNALWLSFIIYLFMRGFVQSIQYKQVKKHIGI